MLEKFSNIFRIPELRDRVLFTLFIFLICRIGAHIPTPGINAAALGQFFEQSQNTLFGLYDMFTGGAFQKVAIFGLGIMPYISASIIIQLMGTTVPYFQRLVKEGEQGRKKITQLTRYGTVLISLMQASGVSVFLESITSPGGESIVLNPGLGFKFSVILMLTTGCLILMWLGEQITERGLGNGISLIIFIGVIETIPNAFFDEFQQVAAKTRPLLAEIFLLGLMVASVMAAIMMTQGVRKIPVQYAKRVVGKRMMGGQSTNIPLRINMAGVMPIIFAQSIMFVPQTLASMLPESGVKDWVNAAFTWTAFPYLILYWVLIIFFTYFYTAMTFNPVEVAENLKRYGGFIPGVRPGKKTAEFIDHVITRISFPGAVFLGFLAIFPQLLIRFSGDLLGGNLSFNFASIFGGTGLLIMVGVALDTLQQIESHLTMRHYDGLMKTGRIRGRSRMSS
ncbi:MAG: preprotein translocase subunit SecY [Calditrichaeota bacterium]|nr:preprotein translocase subunit SecY [Calditrichota bacterium]